MRPATTHARLGTALLAVFAGIAASACPPGDPIPDAGDVGAFDADLDAWEDDAFQMPLPDGGIVEFVPDTFVGPDANEDAHAVPPDAPFDCGSCAAAGPCEVASCVDSCVYTPVADGTDCAGDVCIAGSCVPRACGDGWREDGTAAAREACDDGNLDETDACSSACLPLGFVVERTEDGIDFPPGPRFAVGVDGTGAPLYVWTAAVTSGSGAEIHARHFLPNGGRVSEDGAIVIATALGVGVDPHPVVAGLTSGGWVVAWEDRTVDMSDLGVAYRVVGADGSPGPVQRANETRLLRQHQPAIAATASAFVIAWTDDSMLGSGGSSRVVMRAFPLVGVPGAEAVVAAADASEPSIAVNAAGRSLVAWTDVSGSGRVVRGRRFDAATSVGDVIGLDAASSESHSASVAALPGGDFVAAWVSRERDGGGDIRARTVSAATGALGAVTLDTGASMAPLLAETEPSIAALTDPASLVTYAVGRADTGARAVIVGTGPPELEILETTLADGSVGDVSVTRGIDGVWVSWSQREMAPVSGALRAVYGFYLPRD